jgi:glycosyltransferase involved in cell wall biosynthesis
MDVPNGVWVKKFQTNIDKDETRQKHQIAINSTVLISIGRNHPRKGFEYGLDAVAKLRDEGIAFTYILLGRNMEPIVERARSLGISDFLITPGEVNAKTVSEFIQISDIYISPAIVESFGLATLEAMSAGLPCIVTNVAGSRDLVSSEHGILVDPADSSELANAIIYLINNPSECEKMGVQARIKALKYDWPKIAEIYVDVYREAIGAIGN